MAAIFDGAFAVDTCERSVASAVPHDLSYPNQDANADSLASGYCVDIVLGNA